jgi:hypothetical protein
MQLFRHRGRQFEETEEKVLGGLCVRQSPMGLLVIQAQFPA